ncbi:hypothetical protein Pelo_15832 [Pelomyxa schiedti]|nr:hypothetical protein Pelo_15832 [Pelomyxa schiedti]
MAAAVTSRSYPSRYSYMRLSFVESAEKLGTGPAAITRLWSILKLALESYLGCVGAPPIGLMGAHTACRPPPFSDFVDCYCVVRVPSNAGI